MTTLRTHVKKSAWISQLVKLVTNSKNTETDIRAVRMVAIGLALLAFAVFSRTLANGFVDLDDNANVYENPAVMAGLTFKGTLFAFAHGSMNNWDPLTTLSHMADCQIYGLRPWGHHLTNLLLHTATVVLLFLVLRGMTGALWPSALTAALFAIHPLRVESAAWVTERKDVLSGLFFMLTLGAYLRHTRRPGRRGYALLLLFFALGLMSKAMLVTVPFVLLLLDWWPLGQLNRTTAGRLTMEKIPMIGLAALSAVVTYLAQGNAVTTFQALPVAGRIFNALVSCAVYLRQMVWPTGLAVYYPYPAAGLPNWQIILAVMVLVGLSGVAWNSRKQQPYVLVGWLWYLVMLLPVIGLLQVGAQAHADRYTYLPQIGIYIALSYSAAALVAARPQARSLVAVGSVGVVAILSVGSIIQSGYWYDGESLWTHTIACTSNNWFACNNLGTVLLKKGRVDDAMVEYRLVLAADPHDAMAHYNLGDAFMQKNDSERAMKEYQLALEGNPDDAQAHAKLGTLFALKGRLNEALDHLEESASLDPTDAVTLGKLGTLLLQMGRIPEAVTPLEAAVELAPDFALAQNNLGSALLQLGRPADAVAHFQQVVELRPDDAPSHNNLGSALWRCGRLDAAAEQFEKALELQPDLASAQANLGQLAWLYATGPDGSRNGTRAVELAIMLNRFSGSNNPSHLATLAAAFAEEGRFSPAAATARQAQELGNRQGNAVLVQAVAAQLASYQSGHPFRDPSLTNTVRRP
jgi:tetratricopeptide (TPR) repeat protein